MKIVASELEALQEQAGKEKQALQEQLGGSEAAVEEAEARVKECVFLVFSALSTVQRILLSGKIDCCGCCAGEIR